MVAGLAAGSVDEREPEGSGVTAGPPEGQRSDQPVHRVFERRRAGVPFDDEVRFGAAELERVGAAGPLDLLHDRLTRARIAAVADERFDLVADVVVVGGFDHAVALTAAEVDADTPVVEGRQRERAQSRPPGPVPGRGLPVQLLVPDRPRWARLPGVRPHRRARPLQRPADGRRQTPRHRTRQVAAGPVPAGSGTTSAASRRWGRSRRVRGRVPRPTPREPRAAVPRSTTGAAARAAAPCSRRRSGCCPSRRARRRPRSRATSPRSARRPAGRRRDRSRRARRPRCERTAGRATGARDRCRATSPRRRRASRRRRRSRGPTPGTLRSSSHRAPSARRCTASVIRSTISRVRSADGHGVPYTHPPPG